MSIEIKDAFSNSIFPRSLAEHIDTNEFRHYQFTVGNPYLKKAINHKQAEKHFKNYPKTHTSEYNQNDKFVELSMLETKLTNPKVYKYSIEMATNTELNSEIRKLKKENEMLQNKINQLKESMKKE